MALLTVPAACCQVHVVLHDSKTPVALFGKQCAAGATHNVAATGSLIQVLLQFSRDVDDGSLDHVLFRPSDEAITESVSSMQQLSPLVFDRHRRVSSADKVRF